MRGLKTSRARRHALFGALLCEIEHDDKGLVKQMAHGFDLAGPIPASGVFKRKPALASLTVADVRRQANSTRKGILASTRSSGDAAPDHELHEQTLNEVSKGWLAGSLDLNVLSCSASVTRRFAIRQGPKCRAIDNFKPHFEQYGVCRCPHSRRDRWELADRFDCAKHVSKGEDLVAQAWDLRSGHRQLCVSEDALTESYFSLYNAEIFLQVVLPFRACTSVTG